MNPKIVPYLILLAGCSSLGPKFTPLPSAPQDEAVIYIYRPLRFSEGLGSPDILLDGKHVVTAVNGGYLPFIVSPGNHKIEGVGSDVGLGDFRFDATRGGEYYLRVDLAMNKITRDASRSVAALSTSQFAVAGDSNDGFFADQKEISETTSHVDPKIQPKITNPGFFFVRKKFAETELPKTKLIKE